MYYPFVFLCGCFLFLTLFFGIFLFINKGPFTPKECKFCCAMCILLSIFTFVQTQQIDCQIERYKSNLEKMSFDIAKASIDCKIIGYDDIEKCPLMWEHIKKKNTYKEELSRLLKEKYGR